MVRSMRIHRKMVRSDGKTGKDRRRLRSLCSKLFEYSSNTFLNTNPKLHRKRREIMWLVAETIAFSNKKR
ncbi:hypothetical protein B9Z55_005033 [Caenorhabditis nigoni]|uniref:Uncharacterized protein n=1 Tax=Caenorhabditis nigoni TaxID=1611254 RepID=A0A2G5UZ33_9PELO|nr:hypothetical protein B9Z55_005033 [Caenorhabditis nigoni]